MNRAARQSIGISTAGVLLAVLLGSASLQAKNSSLSEAEDSTVQEDFLPTVDHEIGWSAADPPEASAPPSVGNGEFEDSFFYLMAKLGLGLGLVVLLAWGTMHLLRKSGIGLQGGGDGLIQIVERSYLGPKKSLLLVQAGDWTLMLGVTDDSITRLAQWRTGKAELEKRRESARPFAGYLKSLKEQVPGMPFGEQRGEG